MRPVFLRGTDGRVSYLSLETTLDLNRALCPSPQIFFFPLSHFGTCLVSPLCLVGFCMMFLCSLKKKLFVTVAPNLLLSKGFDQNWPLNDFLQLKLNRKCGEKETTYQPLEFVNLSALSTSSPFKNMNILGHFHIGPKHWQFKERDQHFSSPATKMNQLFWAKV